MTQNIILFFILGMNEAGCLRSKEELDMIHTKNAGINTAIAEVKKMSLSERMRARYEAHLKEIRDRNAREDYVRSQGVEIGRQEGRQEGIRIGEERLNRLNRLLAEQGRVDDIIKAADDEEYRKKLYEEFKM